MSREVHLMSSEGLPTRAHVVYEPVATDIHDDRLGALFQRWRAEAAAGRLVVADRMLQFPEIDPLRGNLMLLDVVDGGPAGRDYLYRLFGQDIALNFGQDMTGRRMSELPGAVARLFSRLYGTAVERGVVIHTLHTPPRGVNITKWERLIFPLGVAPRIQRLLVVNIPKGRRWETETPLPGCEEAGERASL